MISLTNGGGVVVVMDHHGCGSSVGTYDVLNPSGLITVSGATCVSDYTMTISTPADATRLLRQDDPPPQTLFRVLLRQPDLMAVNVVLAHGKTAGKKH